MTTASSSLAELPADIASLGFEEALAQLEAIVRQLESYGEPEIPASEIGTLVMKALIELDIVGYIRYASVYKDFREPEDFNAFVQEIEELQTEKKKRVAE